MSLITLATLPSGLLRQCSGDGLLFCLSEWANKATNGAFWPIVVLGFGMVLFMSTQRFGTPRAFGFSTLISALAAVFLAVAGLIDEYILTIAIILGGVGAVTLVMNER